MRSKVRRVRARCRACLGCSERLWHTLRQQRVDVDAAVYLRLKQLLLEGVALQQQSRQLVGLLQHAFLHNNARP